MQLYLNYFSTHLLQAGFVVFLFSLLVGSFLNVVIFRLPIILKREWSEPTTDDELNAPAERFNLLTPSSQCPQCQHQITWYENIPLISYFLYLKGKCSQCKSKIPFRYPLVELLSALLSVPIFLAFGFSSITAVALIFCWILICLTFIDLDEFILPDRLTLPLLWLGLLVNSQNMFTSLNEAVWGAAAGYLSLWAVYWAFKLITGKEGMGYGDFKLLAALGAWLGLSALPMIILLSSLSGIIIALLMNLFKKQDLSNPIPFGPYLTIAGYISLVWGEEINQMYFQYLL